MALMGSTADKTINEYTQDKDYDLVSVLYHALQAVDTVAQYEQDAKSANTPEIAEFFRDVRDKNNEIAKKAKQLLLKQKQV